jgi:two-component system, NtrC family, sensor kinase
MMEPQSESIERPAEASGPAGGRNYSRLYLRFILLTLICAIVPLSLLGWAAFDHYSDFSYDQMADYFQRRAEANRRIVELFLKERTAEISLVGYGHSLEDLKDPDKLEYIFRLMDQEGSYFTDLGVIDDRGKHMAYVGPYDLMANDYSVTFWFKELMKRGPEVYVSDMFMGYRKTPHFIMAILRREGDLKWILRATIQNEFLSSLLENIKIGDTGEVFLLNYLGVFQTNPRTGGKLMTNSDLPIERFTEESGILAWQPEGGGGQNLPPKQFIAYAWLKEPHWMLVVKQDYAEAFMEVNKSNQSAFLLFNLSLLVMLIVSGAIAGYMIRIIQKRDKEADSLNEQLIHTSKMASVGELAAGVAHEINNPLAIILTANQVIRDLTQLTATIDQVFKERLLQLLSQIDSMVQRCNHITHNLLRFARRTKAPTQLVDLNESLKEVMDLTEKRAKTNGVEFSVAFRPDLPKVLASPAELQQVFVNLINNAIAAHDGKANGSIRINTRLAEKPERIEIEVADSGAGIAADQIGRVFDPFFTTKPVGKGTGLGLSISYSIMKQLGGDIKVQSDVGKGSTFTLLFPLTSMNHEKNNISGRDDV